MEPLDDLQRDIVELSDIYEPDQILQSISEGFEQAALIESVPDKIEMLRTIADELQKIIDEYWEEDPEDE